MPEDAPNYVGSWKGRVITAIAIDGAKTWNEMREWTGIYSNTLNLVLRELFDAGAIKKNKNGEYRVEYELYKQYKEFHKRQQKQETEAPKVKITEKVQKELVIWIDNWKAVKRVDIDLKSFRAVLLNEAIRGSIIVNLFNP